MLFHILLGHLVQHGKEILNKDIIHHLYSLLCDRFILFVLVKEGVLIQSRIFFFAALGIHFLSQNMV